MKKFSFPLEKILRYKRSLYEEARNELARLRHERAALQQRRDDTQNQIDTREAEFHEKAVCGMQVEEVLSYSYTKESAGYLIEELDISIAGKDEEIRKQLKIVIQLDQDVKGLEKLREKQWNGYTEAARLEENERILELVSNKHLKTQRANEAEEQRR